MESRLIDDLASKLKEETERVKEAQRIRDYELCDKLIEYVEKEMNKPRSRLRKEMKIASSKFGSNRAIIPSPPWWRKISSYWDEMRVKEDNRVYMVKKLNKIFNEQNFTFDYLRHTYIIDSTAYYKYYLIVKW